MEKKNCYWDLTQSDCFSTSHLHNPITHTKVRMVAHFQTRLKRLLLSLLNEITLNESWSVEVAFVDVILWMVKQDYSLYNSSVWGTIFLMDICRPGKVHFGGPDLLIHCFFIIFSSKASTLGANISTIFHKYGIILNL